jgi:hypothetical protein
LIIACVVRAERNSIKHKSRGEGQADSIGTYLTSSKKLMTYQLLDEADAYAAGLE